MAVSFVSSSTAQTALNSGATLSIPAPSSISNGNLLICAVNTPTVANGGPTSSLPTGFTEFTSSPFTGGSGVVLRVGWKYASSESGAYSVGLSGATNADVAALMLNYSGAGIGNSAFVGAGSGTSLAVAAPTGIITGGLSVMIGGTAPDTAQSSLTTTLPGTSRVASFYAASGSDFGQGMAASESTTTASGNLTASVTSELAEFTVVINPGPWTVSSTGTWYAPTGVTAVKVECIGGGGAGGSGSVSGAAGGGGAGGSYARANSITVVPGTGYTVTVGAGGAHSTPTTDGHTNPGGDTWFNTSSTVIAKGGAGGGDRATSGNGTAGTGSSTGCIGDVVFAGGSGAAGATASIGGGGGGAAGSAAAGGSASGSTAGTGSSPGANGTAGVSATNATAASAPGGGGGGARATTNTDRLGGNGGAGQIVITDVTPAGVTANAGLATALAVAYQPFNHAPIDPTSGKVMIFDGAFGTSIDTGVGHKFGTSSASYPSPYTTNAGDHKLDFVQSSRLAATGDSVNPQLTITSAFDSVNTVHPTGEPVENCWDTGLITTESNTGTGGNDFQAQTGDFLVCRVQFPSWAGAWPAFWTWNSSGGTNNNEVDIFEYHPDNPNLLELENHAAVSDPSTFYTNPNYIAGGNWLWIGTLVGATSCKWYIGTSLNSMYQIWDDATGVGTGWAAALILNVSITDGFFHPAPTGTGSNTTNFSHMQVWRNAIPAPTNMSFAVKRASFY